MHGLSAEALGDPQALLHRVDPDDLGRARRLRGLDRAQADRPEAQHRCAVTRTDTCLVDGVPARAHHVAGEERGVVRHAVGHAAQR